MRDVVEERVAGLFGFVTSIGFVGDAVDVPVRLPSVTNGGPKSITTCGKPFAPRMKLP